MSVLRNEYRSSPNPYTFAKMATCRQALTETQMELGRLEYRMAKDEL